MSGGRTTESAVMPSRIVERFPPLDGRDLAGAVAAKTSWRSDGSSNVVSCGNYVESTESKAMHNDAMRHSHNEAYYHPSAVNAFFVAHSHRSTVTTCVVVFGLGTQRFAYPIL